MQITKYQLPPTKNTINELVWHDLSMACLKNQEQNKCAQVTIKPRTDVVNGLFRLCSVPPNFGPSSSQPQVIHKKPFILSYKRVITFSDTILANHHFIQFN